MAQPLWGPHLTETTARPFAPHARHRTRDLRSKTLACRLSPSRNKKSGVGINADHPLNHAPAIAGHDTCRTCLQLQRQPQHDFTPRSPDFVSAPAKQPHFILLVAGRARLDPAAKRMATRYPRGTPSGVIPRSIRHTVTSQGFRAFQTFRKRHTVFGCDG
jgi:hypothetical protein